MRASVEKLVVNFVNTFSIGGSYNTKHPQVPRPSTQQKSCTAYSEKDFSSSLHIQQEPLLSGRLVLYVLPQKEYYHDFLL